MRRIGVFLLRAIFYVIFIAALIFVVGGFLSVNEKIGFNISLPFFNKEADSDLGLNDKEIYYNENELNEEDVVEDLIKELDNDKAKTSKEKSKKEKSDKDVDKKSDKKSKKSSKKDNKKSKKSSKKDNKKSKKSSKKTN